MGRAPDSRDLGGDWKQLLCSGWVLVALSEELGNTGELGCGGIYEGQGMELLIIVKTLVGTPSRLCGHCDTWVPPMLITPLVLAVSYGNGSSLLIQ